MPGYHQREEISRSASDFLKLASALSDSDEFHVAHAQHMIDWLLSELPESESLRKQALESMRELGALRAYEWLASKINDWQHQYNVTEIHGELSAPALGGTAPFVPPRAGIDSLVRAIELNPRLADFYAGTKFDGVDEPLSKAPALRHILPVIRRKRGEWLDERVKVYRRHLGYSCELLRTDLVTVLSDSFLT